MADTVTHAELRDCILDLEKMDLVDTALMLRRYIDQREQAEAELERALVDRVEALCVKAWEHDAATLRAIVQDYEAWAMNVAWQNGWGATPKEANADDAFEFLEARVKSARDANASAAELLREHGETIGVALANMASEWPSSNAKQAVSALRKWLEGQAKE